MRYFLVSWCSEGVECLQDVTCYAPENFDTENAFAVLSGGAAQSNPLSGQIHAMTMRARFNSQRFYEIYMFTSSDDVTEADMNSWADSSPQGFADWVRKNHSVCLFADRVRASVIV